MYLIHHNIMKDLEMKVKYVKWFGLLGALFSGVSQIIAGDVVGGGGVIAAALSSAGVFSGQQ